MGSALLTVRVAARTALADDIVGFDLVAADGSALPAFEAGAHVDVHLPAPAAGLVRPYSLCNRPGETARWQIAVLREAASRGGSAAMHTLLTEGTELQVSAPRNQFALAPGARRSLLLAGGIGITPLLAMAEQLHADGADFELHHCTRSWARTPFRQRLDTAPYAQRVVRHLDDGPAAQRLDAAALLARPEPGMHLYVCGPGGFMDHVLATARAAGWPEEQLHWERFGAELAARSGDMPFDVVLARAGITVCVQPGQSIVRALDAAGVVVPTSCEQGVCGTCLTTVLEGTPDHRDQYLTPEEQAANDQMLPCCSRARSARLVLDL